MSTNFDFNSQPPAAAAPGAPGAGTATLPPPAAPAPRAATKPAAEIDSEPISGLKTLVITAAPPIAMIAASYLAHLYGQWMMIGLAIAAVIGTALGVKALWRRARDRRASKGSRAARTARTNPSARAGGRLLGSRGTGATSGKSGGGLFGRGGKGAAGRKTAAQASGGASPSAGARAAKRNATAAKTGAGKGAAGTGKGLAGRHVTSGRSTGPGKSTGRTGAGGLGSRSSAARTGGGTTKPNSLATRPGAGTRSGTGGSTSRNTGAHAKPGLTKRALAKLTGRGHSSAGGSSTGSTAAAKKSAAAKKKAALKKKNTAPKPTVKKTGRKAAAAARAAKKAGKKTPVTPKKKPTPTKKSPTKKGAAKSPTKTKRKTTAAGKRKGKTPVATPKKKSYTKGAKKMHRRLKRAATSRKIRMMKRGGKRLWRGGRRAMRAGNAFVSPLIAKGLMGLGKRLGWAHRHMLRIANSSSGPNFVPRIARGMAWGLAKALRSGQWVMRRRTVSSWLLRHYAATGMASPVGIAASVARKVSLKKVVKVNPGAPVPIHVPATPTTTGARTVGATPIEAVSEAFDFVTGQYEPQTVEELTQHLNDFAPMFVNFAESLMRMAERLQDQYGVKPGVVEMLLEFASASAGMTDMVQSVIESWRIEQAEDIERHENPRPNEGEFWNVQP
ncbi:hypothetical protein ACIP6P_27290 [Streptomyces sp. NPDC088729]|uniref:hypothetical protein n=1 Tax=Streptomyces sp. NPDC088729 TaxID=3365876 RepID=UPI0037FD4F4D